MKCQVFLSTLSLRRATLQNWRKPHGQKTFLSTLSLRRATMNIVLWLGLTIRFLSTLSLRRATIQKIENGEVRTISIHALLAESDVGLPVAGRIAHRISIHALLAESDVRVCEFVWAVSISIHALLAESDTSSTVIVILSKNFYPRSPCGERQIAQLLV